MRTRDTFKIFLMSAFSLGSLGTVLSASAEEEETKRQIEEVIVTADQTQTFYMSFICIKKILDFCNTLKHAPRVKLLTYS